MLRAVTFDLWQTLILVTQEGLGRAREDRVRGVHAVLARHGLAADLAGVGLTNDAVGIRLEEIWESRKDVGPDLSSAAPDIRPSGCSSASPHRA